MDKEWKKLETIPAWELEKVKSKKEVILEARRDKNKVHFATLMDICHFVSRRKVRQKIKSVMVSPGPVPDQCIVLPSLPFTPKEQPVCQS